MALHGTLQQVPLRELIELAEYSALSGAVDICGERNGRLFFHNGQIYHIECEGQSGIEALGMLLNVQRGTFNVISGACSEQQSVWGDTATILRNAERAALRWRRIERHVPTLTLAPALLASREAAQQQTGVELHLLLDVIDGRTPLIDIAATLKWAAIDVAEGVAQLVARGLVRLQQTPAPATSAEQPASVAQPKPTVPAASTFDRLLSILRS